MGRVQICKLDVRIRWGQPGLGRLIINLISVIIMRMVIIIMIIMKMVIIIMTIMRMFSKYDDWDNLGFGRLTTNNLIIMRMMVLIMEIMMMMAMVTTQRK